MFLGEKIVLNIYRIMNRLNIACRIYNYGLTRLGGMAIFGAYCTGGMVH